MPHGSGEQLVHALERDETMADVGIIVLTGRTDEQAPGPAPA